MSFTFEQLNAMSTEELRTLNNNVAAIIRSRMLNINQEQAAKFRVGQVAGVSRRVGGPIDMYVRIQKFNTKTVTAVQVNKDGTMFGTYEKIWRVSPALLVAL